MSFGTSEEAFGGASAKAQFARFDLDLPARLAKHDTFFASAGDDGSLGSGRAHHQGRPSTTRP